MRPDLTGTGVWACGACDKVHHLGSRRADERASNTNREYAEKCCMLRTCLFCGEVTDRGPSGQYDCSHEKCIPKYEPKPPHPSMAKPFARLLYQKMSAISEDYWAACWISRNEFRLWEALQGATHRYGMSEIPGSDLDELRVLSEAAGGWIWTENSEQTEQLVLLEVWKSLFEGAVSNT